MGVTAEPLLHKGFYDVIMYLMSILAHPGKEKTAFQRRLNFHITGEGSSNNFPFRRNKAIPYSVFIDT